MSWPIILKKPFDDSSVVARDQNIGNLQQQNKDFSVDADKKTFSVIKRYNEIIEIFYHST